MTTVAAISPRNFHTLETSSSQWIRKNEEQNIERVTYPGPGEIALGLTRLDFAFDRNMSIFCTAQPSRDLSLFNGMSSRYNVKMRAHGDTLAFNVRVASLDSWTPGRLQIGSFGLAEYWHGRDRVPLGRETRARIQFKSAYAEAPKVIVALTGIESFHQRNTRMMLSAENIDSSGFDLVCKSWDDTQVYDLTCNWIAFRADDPCVRGGTFQTSAPDSSYYAGTYHDPTGVTAIEPPLACRPTRVFHAISGLDLPCDKNIRVETSIEDASSSSFSWTARAWDDSKLFCVVCSWIAIDDMH